MKRIRSGAGRSRQQPRIGAPDPALTANAGLPAITELCDQLGVIAALDAAIGPIKAELARGLPHPARGGRRAGFEEPAQHCAVQVAQRPGQAGLPPGDAAAGEPGKTSVVGHGAPPYRFPGTG